VQAKNSIDNKKIIEVLQSISSQQYFTSHLPIIVVCNDAAFTAASLNNFLWVTFTRANPANDIYGMDEFVENKHWGCNGSLIIDATIKLHHAPPVEKDSTIEKKIDRLFRKGGSLEKVKV
jgi:4-hydroxy-3-polyprenylbenzoate decarboxylase